MSNWKFTDASERVVFRAHEEGSQESCLVEVIADWLAEGNTPEPADPLPEPVIPPLVVSRYQGFMALSLMGRAPDQSYLQEVETYMLTAHWTEQLAWKTIQEFREDSALLWKVAALLGLDTVMVKDLLRFASTIKT